MRLSNLTRTAGVSLAALATAVTFAGPLHAEETGVKEVEVSIDLDQIKDPEAAVLWTNTAKDLHDAIIARVLDQAQEDGVKIAVDIDEVELSNSYEQALGIGDTKLAGRVNVYSDTDNSKFRTYDLSVGFDSSYLPSDSDAKKITIESPAYYQAMVQLFAERVVSNL